MITHYSKRGFTLIELLVVIAIIGILSAVVLAALNTSRAKGTDGSIKQDLSTVTTQAVLDYDAYPTAYAASTVAPAAADVTTAWTVGTGAPGTAGVTPFSTTLGTCGQDCFCCNQSSNNSLRFKRWHPMGL